MMAESCMKCGKMKPTEHFQSHNGVVRLCGKCCEDTVEEILTRSRLPIKAATIEDIATLYKIIAMLMVAPIILLEVRNQVIDEIAENHTSVKGRGDE